MYRKLLSFIQRRIYQVYEHKQIEYFIHCRSHFVWLMVKNSASFNVRDQSDRFNAVFFVMLSLNNSINVTTTRM